MATGVLADANVLWSRTLRDWLFQLRLEANGMFTVQATEDILAEVIYTLRREHPEWDGSKITRIRDHLSTFLDERIEAYPTDGSYPLSDPDDRHVHAAAVAGESDKLLTCDTGWLNLSEDLLDQLPYEVHHPDSFFVLVDDSASWVVRAVTLTQAQYWYSREGEVDLAGQLRKAACPEFAERVAHHLMTIDCSEITGSPGS